MKYLKTFNNDVEYEQFTNSSNYITPNICYIENNDSIVFKPYVKNIFPMYLHLTKVDNKTYSLGPTEETIALCDYFLENAVYDDVYYYDLNLSEGQLYIDDVNVMGLYRGKNLSHIEQWTPRKNYFSNQILSIELYGENKGLIKVIDDD